MPEILTDRLHRIAYSADASVYREFQTIDTFIDEINKLTKNRGNQ